MSEPSGGADVASLATALLDRGNRLMERGEFSDAIKTYRLLTRLLPQFGPAYRNLALALERDGKLTGALSASRRAVALQPDDLDAHLAMAKVLIRLERVDLAVSIYEHAVSVAPGRSDVWTNLAGALAQQGRLDDATAACRKAIDLFPLNANAYINLGVIRSRSNDQEGAVEAYRKAISLDPQSSKAFSNLGVALSSLGKAEAAIKASSRATELRPHDAELHYNHAMLLLLAGDLKAGFDEFEWRLSHPAPKFRPKSFDVPRWRGEPRQGRTLLIHAEQGLGDSLQFIRFVPHAARTGGPVILQVQPPLVELVRDSMDVAVIASEEAPASFDLHAPLMSLPHILGTTLEKIPAATPYLKVDPTKAAEWRERLANYAGLRVGVVWAGSPDHRHDHMRSLPAEMILPRLLMPGLQVFSLQKDIRSEDSAALERFKGQVVDLGASLVNFAETAAVVSAMDLVISVDTAVAHLAGSLGKPTWILLPQILDWRWLYDRTDTPWYPTARLFRQRRSGDWPSVLNQLPAELQRVAGTI